MAPGRAEPPRATWAHHGVDFVAAVESGHLDEADPTPAPERSSDCF